MSGSRELGTRQLTTGALLAALALILGLAAYYLPLVGAILSLVTPLPVVVAQLRYGYRLGGLTTAAATALAAILSGPLTGVFVFSNCVVGMALAWGMERRWYATRTVLLAGVVGFGAAVLSIAVGILVIGPESIQQAADAMEASFAATGAALGATLGEQWAADYARIAVLALANLWLWLGVFTALSSLLIAFVWYGVSVPVLSRLGFGVPAMLPPPPAARWHLPPLLGVAFLVAYFALMFVGGRVAEGSAAMLLFQLVALVVTTGFQLQGFGLAAHLLSRFSVPAILRVLGLLLLAVNVLTSPVVFMLLLWAGMIDLALDLRGFARQGSERGPATTGPRGSAGESSDNRPEAED